MKLDTLFDYESDSSSESEPRSRGRRRSSRKKKKQQRKRREEACEEEAHEEEARDDVSDIPPLIAPDYRSDSESESESEDEARKDDHLFSPLSAKINDTVYKTVKLLFDDSVGGESVSENVLEKEQAQDKHVRSKRHSISCQLKDILGSYSARGG
mmetsp:Transcript_17710/g.26013  ORF Transcript_17710/g.26013 Transcript_17710/m.26013 type:complete len:155 (+) Transcript_17710:20-484(+)